MFIDFTGGGGMDVLKTPHQLFQWAVDEELVYCGGRGEGHEVEGEWVYLATKRAVRKANDNGPAGFHCSSWTNYVLAYFTGTHPRDFTPRGNMPSLFKLCESDGFMFDPVVKGKRVFNRPVPIKGYGSHCTPLPFKTYRELVEGDLGGFDLVVLGESTKKKGGGWKWWHHTAAVARHDVPSAGLVRCAADGFRQQNGTYSNTPMDIETLDESRLRLTDSKKMIRAYGVKITTPQFGVAREL